MCTGRIDLSFVFRAFAKGADGVLIGGCWPGECHYVTEGNYDALANVHVSRKLLERIGLRPERLRIEWLGASEGTRFAEVMTDFSRQMKELGPLGRSESLTAEALELRLGGVSRLIPYLKLVEQDRLRPPARTEQAIDAFFSRDEMNTLFDELAQNELVVAQILLLLGEGPVTPSQIGEKLALSTAAVAQRMERFSSWGLVEHDPEQGSYSLAPDRKWALSEQALISCVIDPEKCKACMICLRKCPNQAIEGGKKTVHVIDQEKCNRCGVCVEACPPRFGAVSRIGGAPRPSDP